MNTSLIMLTCIRLMISSVYLPPISGYRENDRWNAWGYLNEQIKLRAREQHYTHSAAQPVNMKTIKQLISKGKKSPCSTQLAKARQNLGALDTVKRGIITTHHKSSSPASYGRSKSKVCIKALPPTPKYVLAASYLGELATPEGSAIYLLLVTVTVAVTGWFYMSGSSGQKQLCE